MKSSKMRRISIKEVTLEKQAVKITNPRDELMSVRSKLTQDLM
jgi:hypothetical protein